MSGIILGVGMQHKYNTEQSEISVISLPTIFRWLHPSQNEIQTSYLAYRLCITGPPTPTSPDRCPQPPVLPQPCHAHSHLTCCSLDLEGMCVKGKGRRLPDTCNFALRLMTYHSFRKAFPDHPCTLPSLPSPCFLFLHIT